MRNILNEECGCKNNYNETTFMESFGSEESLKKCNQCENMKYEDGNMICRKFNKED